MPPNLSPDPFVLFPFPSSLPGEGVELSSRKGQENSFHLDLGVEYVCVCVVGWLNRTGENDGWGLVEEGKGMRMEWHADGMACR